MTPEWIGRRIRSYEVLSLLGAGSMGQVYRARDTKLGRDVAIKVLPSSLARDHDRVTRFHREARALAALNHPHIAGIYGFEEVEGDCALVLELVEGRTLAERLALGAMPVKEALATACQIASALEAAHKKGIIHRDLRPANIKITPDGTVKVLDFGLAKAFANDAETGDLSEAPTETRQGTILGTSAYMSPEQATGQALDKRTDIWAFGCVLYEMLTRRRAFTGDTVPEVISAILVRELNWEALPADTPRGIQRLLRRCVEKDPKNRVHDIADARIELDETLSALTSAVGVTRTPATARPWRLVGTVAAAIVLVALGAYLALRVGWNPRREAAVTQMIERQITRNSNEHWVTFGAISPDGKYVVYSDPKALYLRLIDTGETRPIPVPPGLCFV